MANAFGVVEWQQRYLTGSGRVLVIGVPGASGGCASESPLGLTVTVVPTGLAVAVGTYTVDRRPPGEGFDCAADQRDVTGRLELDEAWLLAGPSTRTLVVRLGRAENRFRLEIDVAARTMTVLEERLKNVRLLKGYDLYQPAGNGAWRLFVGAPAREQAKAAERRAQASAATSSAGGSDAGSVAP